LVVIEGLCENTRSPTPEHVDSAQLHRGEDLYEFDGFIVHFFSEEKIAQVARGFKVLSSIEFEEGELPRSLSLVTLRKQS
jgi:hypothetical protein